MPKKTQEPVRGGAPLFHTPSPLAKRTFLYPICMGHFYCDENYCVERGRYDSFLMMAVVKGSGYIEIAKESGVRRTIAEGQIGLIDCYEPHRYGADGEMEFYWMHFDGINARAYYQFLAQEYGTVMTVENGYRNFFFQKFEFLLENLASEQGIQEHLLGYYLTDMLTFPEGMVQAGEQTGTEGVSQEEIVRELGRTLSYVRQHFTEPITVKELAGQMAVSPYHYIRLFRRQYGITPHQYLLSMRLDCARFLLRSGEKTVKEIAFSCGFGSENNFCQMFRKQVGVTPTEYRKGKG